MDLIIDSAAFRNNLLNWFENNARKLPWRNDPHWYKTFLSEFMLQQTQVEQVIPYYHKFYNRFPNIERLASADEHEILTIWAGLGYYSRARNLRKAAIMIVNDFSGKFPLNINEVLSLPGIGVYTAHAILSIAFNKPFAVVDGNVKRVISRLFTINDDISSKQGFRKISMISEALLDKRNPSKYNEAVMELGATVCKTKNAHCMDCPVKFFCNANAKNSVHFYPVKTPAKRKKELFYYTFVIEYNRRFLIIKRPSKGLLASMWEFPSIEGQKNAYSKNQLNKFLNNAFGIKGEIKQIFKSIKHQYTHINASYTPIRVIPKEIKIISGLSTDYEWVEASELMGFPIHAAHKKIIKKLKI